MRISEFVSLDNVQEATLKITQDALLRLSLWVQDAGLFLFGKPKNIPTPMLGFSYVQMGEAVLMDFDITMYPYLRRALTANGSIKKANSFTVKAMTPLTPENTLQANALKMNILLPALEKYTQLGGLYTFVTPYYVFRNCMLSRVVAPEEKVPGTVFTFEFLQPVISSSDLSQISLNEEAYNLSAGGVV